MRYLFPNNCREKIKRFKKTEPHEKTERKDRNRADPLMELEVNVLSRDCIKKKHFLKSYEQTNQAINVPTESIIVEFLARIVLTCALAIIYIAHLCYAEISSTRKLFTVVSPRDELDPHSVHYSIEQNIE